MRPLARVRKFRLRRGRQKHVQCIYCGHWLPQAKARRCSYQTYPAWGCPVCLPPYN